MDSKTVPSEEKLRDILSLAAAVDPAAGLAVADAAGTLLAANERLAALLSRDAPPVGLSVGDCFPQGHEHAWADPAIIAGSAPRPFEAPGPTQRWLHIQVNPLAPAFAPAAWMVRVSDVTGRVAQSRRSQELEEQIVNLVRPATDTMWCWEIGDNSLVWTGNMEAVFGWTPAQVAPTLDWWSERIHPDDLDAVLAGLERAEKSPAAVWADRYRFLRADGTYARVLDTAAIVRDPASGKALRMVGTMRDVSELERAHELRRAQDQRYQAAAEAAADTVYDWDLITDRVWWNDGVSRLFGYPLELVGSESGWWSERIHPDERARIMDSIHAALSGTAEFWESEYRFQCADGTYAHVLDRGVIRRDQAGRAIRMTGGMIDETAHRAILDQMTDRQRMLELALRAANLGVWRCGLDRGDEDFLEWSPEVYSMFDVTPDEFDGTLRAFYSRAHPDDIPLIRRKFGEALAEGTFYDVDHRIILRDGSIRWINEKAHVSLDAAGRPRYLVGICQDFTAQKQSEQALRLSESRFRRLTSAGLFGVVFADLDGGIHDANDEFLRIVGYSREDLASGQVRWDALTPAEFRTADEEAVAQIRTRGKCEPYEKEYVRKDGLRVPVLIGTAVQDGDHIVGFIIDMSDRAEAQRVLMEAKAGLERSVRQRTRELMEAKGEADAARDDAARANAAKSEFLSRMSHELRTPLNAILGFAQLLEFRVREQDNVDAVRHILKSGRHLLMLLNEVLDITRIEAGKMAISPEIIPLRDVVQTSIEMMRPMLSSHDVTTDWQPAPGEALFVVADPNRLRQVVLNILSNAIKYNRRGGTVTVRARAASSERAALDITDTGTGIAPELIDRLFVPFDRLGMETSDIEGSGLGLALSQRLLHTMNGRLHITSEPGRGTKVTIDLERSLTPPKTDPSEASAPPGPMPVLTCRPGTAVLYIEDNLSNLQLVETIFAMFTGVELLSAVQGGAGLEIAVARKPDLILLDLNLPDIDGYGVLSRLRADPATCHIPVVVVSADATPGQIERLRKAGAAEYLTKPLNVTQFLATMRQVLPAP